MKCPICRQSMEKLPSDISQNANDSSKEYVRTIYRCKTDDAWVTIELPVTSL